MNYLLSFAATLAVSLVFTRLLIATGRRMPLLVRTPSDDRWHRTATPSLGGISIFFSFLFGLALFERPALRGIDLRLLLGSSLIFFLGLLDDLKPLPAYVKLVGQISVACLMVMLGVHPAGEVHALISIPLTILWFVAITNAFNLLDNMDGLAGGVACIAVASLAFLTWMRNGALPLHVHLLFVASVSGFLVFNFHPARIFMGDCGAQWLGFMLAGLTILDTWTGASNLFLMLLTPVLILAVPIFDTTLVALNRKIHGRAVSRGGRDHSSHRLVALGLSERKTVLTLWGLAAVFGLLAVFAHQYGVDAWAVLVGMGVVFSLVLGIFLTDVKMYAPRAPGDFEVPRWARVTLLYKRRLLEIGIDTALIGGAYVLSYLIRFDWSLHPFQLDLLARTLPLVVGVKLLVFLSSGLYRGIWTYIDFAAFARLLRSSVLASAFAILVLLVLYRFFGFSRTLFIIDFILLLMMMGGTRALLRGLRESVFAFPDRGIRVLIVGAGDATRALLTDIRKNRQWNLTPVGLVDDHPRKKGNSLLGIRVLGPTADLSRLVREKAVDRIIVAIPSATPSEKADLEQRCIDTGIPFVMMKSVEESLIRKIL